MLLMSKDKTNQNTHSSITNQIDDSLRDLWNIGATNNFENVYFKRNDSIYKRLWYEAYENEPPSAFLISCTYYYVSRNDSVLNDIELSKTQLESIYHCKLFIAQ